MAERLSGGEIAHIVGGLIEGEKNPVGAQRVLLEIRERLLAGEPIDSHLADYLVRAIGKLRFHDATDAFGLAKPQHRPPINSERDEMIAYLVHRQREVYGLSIEAAIMEVRDYLLEREPSIDLSLDRIKDIFDAERERSNPFIQSGG